MSEHVHHGSHAAHNHEKSDAHVPSIYKFVVGTFALLFVSMLAMWVLFIALEKTSPQVAAGVSPMAVERGRVIPTGPRLQTVPNGNLPEFRQHEDSVLATYGWIDKNDGVVRIPVDRALDVVAEKGLPVFQAPPVRGPARPASAPTAAGAANRP
jgi:hypothetical protein